MSSIELLEEIKDRAGENWRQYFVKLMNGNVEADEEMEELYDAFIESYRDDVIAGGGANAKKIERIIDNDAVFRELNQVLEASLTCYKACATIRVMEKKDLTKTKKMLEEVYQKAVLRFSPEIVDAYTAYGFETCEAFTNFLNEFKSVCEFIADRNFYYDSIINALKENMHVSRELCEFLAGLLDANMEKMQMILLLHRLHQVKS